MSTNTNTRPPVIPDGWNKDNPVPFHYSPPVNKNELDALNIPGSPAAQAVAKATAEHRPDHEYKEPTWFKGVEELEKNYPVGESIKDLQQNLVIAKDEQLEKEKKARSEFLMGVHKKKKEKDDPERKPRSQHERVWFAPHMWDNTDVVRAYRNTKKFFLEKKHIAVIDAIRRVCSTQYVREMTVRMLSKKLKLPKISINRRHLVPDEEIYQRFMKKK